ncbi:hypothetical protein J7K44_01070 [bacterium]|nr:hypothetical protein [bacterium]
MRKSIFWLGLLVLMIVVAVVGACRAEGISVEGNVQNEMNVLIPNQYIFPHNYPPPSLYNIPDTEPYFGGREETYNITTDLLLQMLKIKDEWSSKEAEKIRKGKVKSDSRGLLEEVRRMRKETITHRRLTTFRRKRRTLPLEKRVEKIKVITSSAQLEGVKYELIGPVIVYAKGMETTIDCFAQGIIDTVKLGGNALFLLKAGSDFRVKSSTLGVGVAYSHSYIRGNHGGSGGGGTGWARNFTEPQTKPWLHGIALKIPVSELQKIKPDLKLHPEKIPQKKEVPVEQKAIQEYNH